jgi:signal transduction protein with GAF and PtsI domain
MNKLVTTAIRFGKKKATKGDTAKKVGIWAAKMAAGTAIWVGFDHAAQRGLDAAFDRTVQDRTDDLERATVNIKTHSNQLADAVNELNDRVKNLEKHEAPVIIDAEFAVN